MLVLVPSDKLRTIHRTKKPPPEGFTREISPCTSRCTSCWTNNCSDKGCYASKTHAAGILRIRGEGSQPTQPTNAVRDSTLPKRNDNNGCLGLRSGHEVVARHVREKLLAEPTCHAYHGEIEKANGSIVIADDHGTSKPSARRINVLTSRLKTTLLAKHIPAADDN